MAYFQRKLEDVIARWQAEEDARPLLIKGARRVGKTVLCEHVGERLFAGDYVKLDFQTDLERIGSLFDIPTSDTGALIARIAEYLGRPIAAGRTLVVLDEVQLSERALNSLRFFSGGPWRVIATGSLLGVATRRRELPYPAGVREVELHPMDFEEHLWALGQRPLAEAIRAHARSGEPFVHHERALELFHRYEVLGGMPGVLSAFSQANSFEAAAEAQEEIDRTYTRDMTDPSNGISGISAQRIWASLPKQLMRASTKKFKYSEVVRGGRRTRLLEPLEWLAAAGMVTINDLTTSSEAQLFAYRDDEGSFFKVYCADTGLMFHKLGLGARAFLDPVLRAQLSSEFRGAIAENYAMQALSANDVRTFYWMPSEKVGRGEIEFVHQTRLGEVVPIEVKSSRNVSAATFSRFLREGRSRLAVRLSERDFGIGPVPETEATLHALPLYAAFCLDEDFLEGGSQG